MRVRFTVALAVAVAATLAAAAAAAGAGLQPGVASAGLRERVLVNVVFVGFDQSQARAGEFLSGLPQRYRPVVRSRLPYGVSEELGIDYSYDYSLTYTSSNWESSFF